jgi:hypothetical protein
MRLIFSHQSRGLDGNVLLTSLVISGALGFVLAGYLTLVGGQHKMTTRSQSWNAAIPVAEAGVEEALSQLNANGTNLVANNNWTLVDGKYFLRSRTIGENRYLVGFFNNRPPVIVAQGFTPLPLTTNMMSRTIKAKTSLVAVFSRGMVAKEQIDLGGNSMELDSFDSVDPNYSTLGMYDPSKRKDNASIATNSSLTNSFNVGNATIRGKISTGPGGVPNIGGSGSVGSDSWVNGGNDGIQAGAFKDDMNVSFPDVEEPFVSALPPVGGTDASGNVYTYILGDGDWQISSPLKFDGQVLVTGNAVLYVTSAMNFGSGEFIKIQPGASLKLYVSAANVSIGGKGVLNETGDAANFAYYGLPSNKKLTLSGNSALVGTIYAPQADFTLGGGGTTVYDFVGASITKNVTMNGHYNFHYDENLRRVGPQRWVAVSWDEIQTTWDQIQTKGLGEADL